MLRILSFFLLVLVGALVFSWLADNPGTVSLNWLGSEVQTSVTVFIIVLALFVLAVLLAVWLIGLLFKTPGSVGSWWSGRKRDRGYAALSQGIIAAGAGDAVLARRMAKRSEKFLGARREPLVRFLDAQTAMIEGDHARARSAFEQMERDPETRLLALRGLYLEAERTGDSTAARYYAERAARVAPQLPWAGGAVLEAKSVEGDYEGALAILEARREARLVDRNESKRMRAVLLTGKAMDLAEKDPAAAKTAAVEATKLAPDLVPAAIAAARAMFRLGDLRGGSKILETAWTNSAHPEIADTYVNARPGDSVADRIKRAERLRDLKPGNVESHMALAHAALDARDFALARREALAAVAAEPRQSGYLLLADIEEEETGQIGRVREWLARAIRAPRDPVWMADGYVAEHWAPVSPVTGRLDAFQWKVPPERPSGALGPVIENAPGDEARTVGGAIAHEAAPAAGTGASAGTNGATKVAVPAPDAPDAKAGKPAVEATAATRTGAAASVPAGEPAPARA